MKRETALALGAVALFQTAVVLGMVARKQSILITGTRVTLETTPVDPHSLFRGDYARLSYALSEVDLGRHGLSEVARGDRVWVELAPGEPGWTLTRASSMPLVVPAGSVQLRGRVRGVHGWSGHRVADLRDDSDPGWLKTQDARAPWRDHGAGPGRGMILNAPKPLVAPGAPVYAHLHSWDGKTWFVVRLSRERDAGFLKGSPERHPVIVQGRAGAFEAKRAARVEYGIESFFLPEGKGRAYERGKALVDLAVSARGEAVIRGVRLPEGT